MPSVTSDTASMVVRTGCLMDSSLRNISALVRFYPDAVGDLEALFRDQLIAFLQSGGDFGRAVALAGNGDFAADRSAVLDDEDRRLAAAFIAVQRGSRN